MKKVLNILGLVILNTFLLGLALYLYNYHTVIITRKTDFFDQLEGVLTLPAIIAGIIAFSNVKKFRPYSIGVTALGAALLIHLVFYLNRSLAGTGEYETFEVRGAEWEEGRFYLNIGFNMWYNATEVSEENCINVDSVQVRIDDGFFGMPTMSNEVRIKEGYKCDDNPYENHEVIDFMAIGLDYFHRRCFRGAIEQFTNEIKRDTLNPASYYWRGLSYMAMKVYSKALIDFLSSAYIDYYYSNGREKENIDSTKLKSFTNELLHELDKGDSKIIKSFINRFNTLGEQDACLMHIRLCRRKIEELHQN